MRLIEFFGVIDEAKFRKPIEMYHGTSSAFLRTILKQGVIPNPSDKTWQDDPDINRYNFSRASLPGSYWTSNLMTAISSSTTTARKFPGEPIIIIAQISEQSSFADEDNINSSIQYAIPAMYGELFGGGLTSEAAASNSAYVYYGKPENQPAMQVAFGKILHNDLSSSPQQQPINQELMTSLLEALLLRAMAFEKKEKDDGGWGSSVLSAWGEMKNAPAIPTVQEMEQVILKLRDKLTQSYTKTAYADTDSFRHTLRITEPVTYRGANKIIGIISEPPKEDGQKIYGRPLIAHYGTATPNYLEQYRQRVGQFPGLLDRNGKEIIPSQRTEE